MNMKSSLNMNDKVDFVITWVDGNDEKWKHEKEKYSKNKENDCRRYRNWDTLKYWFRGVDKFSPWVNQIHFVTWGHRPEWLNTNHPKINIVYHKDFIPGEWLPTFNSRVIELNFHRISELSDKFVYFNDDMFLLKKVESTIFFKNNLPCDSLILDLVHPSKDTFNSMLFNNMAIINHYFNKKDMLKKDFFKIFNLKYHTHLLRTFLLLPFSNFPGIYNTHLPISYRKEIYREVWAQEEEVLKETGKHKCRQHSDVNHYLFRYWQLVSGRFTPSPIQGKYMSISKDKDKIMVAIRKQIYKMICINDEELSIEFDIIKKELLLAFDKILPDKCSYEV